MAIQAGAVWEIRTGGSNNNGGGFDSTIAGAGTDYSQQTTAALALTDLAAGAGSTTLTSATGGFTAQHVGNCIYIRSGTNFTAGWYFITGCTNANTVTLDRAPNSVASSGGSGNVGGARAVPTSAFWDAMVPGNLVWYKAGTYNLTESPTASGGIGSASGGLIKHHGYNATRGDAPTGANRPTFACGSSYQVIFGAYTSFENIIVTSSAATVALTIGANGIARNLKVAATGGGQAATLSSSMTIGCEFSATGATAAQFGAAGGAIVGCYVHDATIGLNVSSSNVSIVACIVDSCATGVSVGANSSTLIFGCVIYNSSTKGVNGSSPNKLRIVESIISACAIGVGLTSADAANYSLLTCWNNTTDVSNFSKGSSDISADPLMTDPANGDFTLGASSPCLLGGLNMGPATGAIGAYKRNMGVDQDNNAAAGGGGAFTWIG
jgi:hypothetical protein